MNALLQKIRLIPIVLVAAGGLLTLKLAGIALDGGYTLGAGHQAITDRAARDAALSRLATRPVPVVRADDPDVSAHDDVTGSVPSKPKPPAAEATAPVEARPVSPVQLDGPPMPASERVLLQRLAERRQELEKRQNELDMRDTLLKAAEQRLETKISDLRDAEARMVAATQQSEDAEKSRLKNLVTMYENMKPKDAAKIFDRLDLKLATEVARLIQPRRMSDIMAQMTPESAQRLTVELASTHSPANTGQSQAPGQLPKIGGSNGM